MALTGLTIVSRGTAAMLVVLSWSLPTPGVEDPFPGGAAMATQGAVVDPAGSTGRDPFTSAAFCADTCRWALAVYAVDYYASMDNFPGRRIIRSGAGGTALFGPLSLKGGASYFDALSIYGEWAGFLGAALRIHHRLNLGFGCSGTRSFLRETTRADNTLDAEAACLLFAGSVSFSARGTLTALYPFDAPLPLRRRQVHLGIHATHERYGSHGVLAELTLDPSYALRFRFGQSLRLHPLLSLQAALATSPFLIGFGVTIRRSSHALHAAGIAHPDLGWSRGLGWETSR